MTQRAKEVKPKEPKNNGNLGQAMTLARHPWSSQNWLCQTADKSIVIALTESREGVLTSGFGNLLVTISYRGVAATNVTFVRENNGLFDRIAGVTPANVWQSRYNSWGIQWNQGSSLLFIEPKGSPQLISTRCAAEDGL
jgi:hypothetical protein